MQVVTRSSSSSSSITPLSRRRLAAAVSFRHKTNYRAGDDDVASLAGREGIDRVAPAYSHDV